MTDFSNRICQTLHQEHMANIALLERVDRLVAAQRRTPPNVADPAVRQLLWELASSAAAEVERHFDFEEQGLFPYLDSIGESAVGAHLMEDHVVLRPLISRLAQAARDSTAAGFDEAAWSEFRRLGGEACERMPAHIQKEETSLLPLIEENMNSETEVSLIQQYLENE